MASPPSSPMYDLYIVSLCPRRMKLEPRGRSFLLSLTIFSMARVTVPRSVPRTLVKMSSTGCTS